MSDLPRGGTSWAIADGYYEIKRGHPWDREPELVWPKPKAERPSTIVNTQDVEPDVRGGRRRRDLGRAAGSRWTGLKHIEFDSGVLSGPPHVHSAEEEIFVVLDGDGTLQLTPPGLHSELAEQAVRKGSVVARPAGTGIAHAFDRRLRQTLIAWGHANRMTSAGTAVAEDVLALRRVVGRIDRSTTGRAKISSNCLPAWQAGFGTDRSRSVAREARAHVALPFFGGANYALDGRGREKREIDARKQMRHAGLAADAESPTLTSAS